jgi:hypothetical protein
MAGELDRRLLLPVVELDGGEVMQEIFDRMGMVVGWLDGGAILDRGSQKWIAFVADELVFTAKGRVLGFFHHGFFQDKSGGAVAFVMGAGKGPLLPSQLVGAAARNAPPRPPIPARPSFPGAPSGGARWGENWKAFVGM